MIIASPLSWREKVKCLLFSHDPEAVEAFCASLLLGFGAWLLRSEPQLAETSLRVLRAWKGMGILEDALGVGLLTLGCIQGACVVLSIRAEWHQNAERQSRFTCFRNWCAMLAFLAWLFLWLLRSTAPVTPPGTYLLPFILGANAWIYIRLGIRQPDMCSPSSLLEPFDSPLDAPPSPSCLGKGVGVSNDNR